LETAHPPKKSFYKDFVEITKARLAISVVFSTIAGYLLGIDSWSSHNWEILLLLAIGGYCMVGASNIFNQIIEKGKVGSEPYYGFNIKTETIENMKDIGIIDPTKVVRNALQNSLSVAKTILLTEAVVYQEPSKDSQESPSLDMGGMF
jgi:chaperonin GroEL (HSP60 family)